MQGFQIAHLRPPTENFSLAINTHFYCPWGKCAFCPNVLFHEERQFRRRTLEEIKADINTAAILNEMLLESGSINQKTVISLIHEYPEVQDCILHLAYWHLYTKATTAFLGGTNPLLYNSAFLTALLTHLKKTFPSIQRITSYGRTKSASRLSSTYFKELHEGVSSEEHLMGGQRIKDGSISLSIYVMPGLGGKKWSQEHALDTAKLINQLEPDFVRLRTLEIFPITPLYSKWKAGEFTELSEEEIIQEERLLIENIDCSTTITSDSASALLTDIWGTLPPDKEKILRTIDNYLTLSPHEKLEFSLQQRLDAYKHQYSAASPEIERKLHRLSNFLKKDAQYYEKLKKLIKFIRSLLIP